MVRSLRPSVRRLSRRTGDDLDVDRINEIANGLAVAALAFDIDDGEMARRAVTEARHQASVLLADAVLEHDARERRRYIGLWASGAATAAAVAVAAALVLVPPTTGPGPITSEQVADAPAPPAVPEASRTERMAERPAELTAGVPAVSGDRLRVREADPPVEPADEPRVELAGTTSTTTTDRATSTGTTDAASTTTQVEAADEPEPHQGAASSGGQAEPPTNAQPGSNRGQGGGNA